jgi:hypothetical protein
MLSTREVTQFFVKYPDWVEAYTIPDDNYQQGLLPTVPDEQYFVYGDAQRPYNIRVEYLEKALLVSSTSWMMEDAVYLLNPSVTSSTGTWEAWYFSNEINGAIRYRSIYDLLEQERRTFMRRAQGSAPS